MPVQITGFCVCTAASGMMFRLFRRIPPAARQSVWPLFGWFTGLMSFGSLAGAAAWTAFLQDRMLFYTFVRADTAASSSSAVAKSRIFYTQADESRFGELRFSYCTRFCRHINCPALHMTAM